LKERSKLGDIDVDDRIILKRLILIQFFGNNKIDRTRNKVCGRELDLSS
jgi:hypothetical protein